MSREEMSMAAFPNATESSFWDSNREIMQKVDASVQAIRMWAGPRYGKEIGVWRIIHSVVAGTPHASPYTPKTRISRHFTTMDDMLDNFPPMIDAYCAERGIPILSPEGAPQ